MASEVLVMKQILYDMGNLVIGNLVVSMGESEREGQGGGCGHN